MPVPNPNNGYIPKIGEKVRIIGACHSNFLGKIVEVTKVYKVDGVWFFEEKHNDGEELFYSGGVLGGVEKIQEKNW